MYKLGMWCISQLLYHNNHPLNSGVQNSNLTQLKVRWAGLSCFQLSFLMVCGLSYDGWASIPRKAITVQQASQAGP